MRAFKGPVRKRQRRRWVIQAAFELEHMPTRLNLTWDLDGYPVIKHSLVHLAQDDVVELIATSPRGHTPTG